ncbi:MAG: hypothetical protein JSS86_18685 [Cyanobacteria bacterium SZAS LIN-2]|nr:hypothetical protein [Cyanobacteria bacterium SZAS LIN-3]MBS1998361.1 hypothetical protein [Cyanobacteria bacterium SZAS LIN-2]
MKPLKDVRPDPQEVLDLEPEQLAPDVLHCLSGTTEPNIKRAIIAKHLASDYHESLQHEIAHAIQEALGWLFAQCLLGASPYDQDLIFLTRRGKKVAADYKAELEQEKEESESKK